MPHRFLAALIATGPAAPVPKPAPPDPMAYAYVGVRMATSAVQNPRLRIDEPEPGTPAAAAGMRNGDEIVRVAGRSPKSFFDFADAVLDLRPGTRVEVVVNRNGTLVTLWLTLGVRPPPPDYAEPDFSRKTIYPRPVRP